MPIAVNLAMLMLVAALTACNTIEGVGRDVASAGEEVAKAADRAK